MEDIFGIVEGGESPDSVQKTLDHQWHLARNDQNTRDVLASMGIELAALDEVGDNPFSAESGGEGNRADFATTIAIGIAIKIGSDIGVKALTQLWDKVIRPKIEQRFGKVEPEPSSSREK